MSVARIVIEAPLPDEATIEDARALSEVIAKRSLTRIADFGKVLHLKVPQSTVSDWVTGNGDGAETGPLDRSPTPNEAADGFLTDAVSTGESPRSVSTRMSRPYFTDNYAQEVKENWRKMDADKLAPPRMFKRSPDVVMADYRGGMIILHSYECQNCGNTFWTEGKDRALKVGLHPCPYCHRESEVMS